MPKAIYTILQKVLVKNFYKQHALILGIVYLVMFGTVQGDQLPSYHLSLIKGTLDSYSAFGIVVAIWFVYYCRVIFFLAQVVHNNQNRCLQQITLLPQTSQYLYLFYVAAWCLLPITSYGIAIIIYGIVYQYYVKTVLLVFLFVVFHFTTVFFLLQKLRNTECKPYPFLVFVFPFSFQKKNTLQFYLKYLFTQQVLQWLIIKFMVFITIGLCFHSLTPNEELRFSTFFYALLFLIHTNLIRQFIIWEKTQFWHSSILPIPLFNSIKNYLLFFIILILPEILFMCKAYPFHLSFYHMFGLLLLTFSSILYIFSVCIAFDNVAEQYMPVIFLYLLFVFIATLSDIVVLFSIFLFVFSLVLYYYSHRKFEIQANSKGKDSYT